MSQLRRSSLDSKLNTTRPNRKDSNIEATDDKKTGDKPIQSARSSKLTGAT